MEKLTKQEREELFRSVDLRRLTGQPVPKRHDQAVRVRCPVHDEKGQGNDLGIFPDHCYCFSAKCGYRARAFDTAAILLGLYSRDDPMWPSKAFETVIQKLRDLRDGHGAPEVVETTPPTSEELQSLLDGMGDNIEDQCRIDTWRGWPPYTASEYGLRLTSTAIAIPVRRSDGKLMTIRYRIRPKLESPERPRYWGTPGLNNQSFLYGGYTMPKNSGKVVVLVEGEFDTISSQCAGVPTLCALNGAGYKEDRADILDRLLTKFERVVIAYDQDEGGQRGVYGFNTESGRRVPGLISDDRPNPNVLVANWNPSLGKDPGEYIKKNGAKAWQSLIRATLPLSSRSPIQPRRMPSPSGRSSSTSTPTGAWR